ncbi:MAG: energy-coupling factor transporter ATPase [Bacilli bacterium]|nr:energy-coupling factor transporter ATPase [Bacilli bacterium]
MAIQIKDLRYVYLPKTPNANVALDGVTLTIPDNAFAAFIGRTGSGKTTLVQHLNALLIPTSGELEVDEFKIVSKKRKNKKIKELRKHLSLVFQFPEYQLFEETVEKDVAFGLKNFGVKNDEAIKLAHEALLSVGLDEKYFQKSPFELSGGERRRVAIAGILAINPDILVLDEPTAGLDVKGAKDVMSLVQKMHENGKTIIMVTHDMDLVMKYCNLVYVLKDGKLAYQGSTDKLFDQVGEDSAIEIPPLYQLAQKLKERGAPIQIENIKSVDDLINQVKGWKKRHE